MQLVMRPEMMRLSVLGTWIGLVSGTRLVGFLGRRKSREWLKSGGVITRGGQLKEPAVNEGRHGLRKGSVDREGDPIGAMGRVVGVVDVLTNGLDRGGEAWGDYPFWIVLEVVGYPAGGRGPFLPQVAPKTPSDLSHLVWVIGRWEV